jgi:SagB-type dehydrogenase family enzyme
LFALTYHESTKHHFDRFAPYLGYLDWANQPDPFRRYAGARLVELPRAPAAGNVAYSALFDRTPTPAPLDLHHLGELLRCSMGLSGWKQSATTLWALRVNPSSGNLHPTETYLVVEGRIAHYAPREHALEERATLAPDAWTAYCAGRRGALVGLTSIHWREAWKYGERAFRYCQHDAGHAIGALRLAAAMLGWHMVLLPRWSTAQLATLLGVDRPMDAEPEEPECLAILTPDDPGAWRHADPELLVDAARQATWWGSPNRLSAGHVDWPAIERVAVATRSIGSGLRNRGSGPGSGALPEPEALSLEPSFARRLILQRRSAVAFDGRSSLPRERFVSMLRRLQPGAPPWDAIDWPPQVHLALFVHRVDGLVPGLYAWLRDRAVRHEWQAAMRTEFLWEHVPNDPNDSNLFLLLPFDMTWPATRVSCDQDIAGDGFFSVGMIARFEPALREYGEWFYRRLFWECGLIGQVLYLEAEAAGERATGIGCYYDDPVHEMLGLRGGAWQSLYHCSLGHPLADPRITSEPGYPWERT